MAHTLKLGYKDDPTVGTDDAIDLCDATVATSGYGLISCTIGEPYEDKFGSQVRQIAIQLEVRGTTNDIAMSRVRKIHRYIARSNLYFDYYKGQYPSRGSITSTNEMFASILTFKASSATKKVYWNIFGGTLSASQPVQDDLITNSIIQVNLTLVVEAAARGDRVKLKNLVPMGDFSPPFNISATFPTLAGGWTFTGTWTPYDNTTGVEYPFLTQSLKSTAASSTATIVVSNVSTTYFSVGDYVLPQCYYKIDNITASNLSIVFQTFDGAVWTTRQSTTANAITADWARWSGTAYQIPAGTTQLRLVVTMPTSGTVDITVAGAAIWLLSSSSQAAPVEYMTYGGKTGLPNINIYNIQGDVPAPCVVRMENQSGVGLEGLFMGQHSMYTFKDYPVFELDYRTSTSTTAATSLFWDTLPTTSSAASTTSTYALDYTFQPAAGTGGGHYVDQAFRTYRAFLVYAANDSAAVTACSIAFVGQSRTYTVSIPQTYTGTANAAAGDFRLFDLGDFVFSRPGLATVNTLLPGGASTAYGVTTQVTLTHSNSANRRTAVAGVILMPVTDGAAYVNFGPSGNSWSFGYRLNFDTEGSAPRIYFDSNANQPIPLQTYNPLAVGTFSGFYLRPELTDDGLSGLAKGTGTVNRLSAVIFSGLNASNDRQFQFNASYAYVAWLEYAPRYLYGFNT